jgi:hypothetical protein
MLTQRESSRTVFFFGVGIGFRAPAETSFIGFGGVLSALRNVASKWR